MLKQKTGRPESFSVFKIVPGFWPEIQAFKALIAGSFAVLVLEICFRLPEPWPLKYVFDSIFSAACQTGGDELLPLVTGPTLEGLIFVAAATFVLFSFLRAISAFESSAGFVLAENRVMTKTRNDLYRYMQPLPLSFHTKSRNGDLLTRLICDMGLLQEVTVTGLLPLFGSVVVPAGMAVIMLWLNWQLALLALAILPAFWLLTVRMTKKIHTASHNQRNTESAMTATLFETMSSIKTVQALSMEGLFNTAFSNEVPREEIGETAKLANAHDFIEKLPQGYDTVLGERGATLSNGQCQRIAIARSVIRKSPILIFDEPAPGPDERNILAAGDALKKLSRERTSFFIPNDISLTTDADQIPCIENGTISEKGTHFDLVRVNKNYASESNMENNRRWHHAQSA